MEELVQYIEACKTAAIRTRLILIILVITSVLTFIAYWNSRQCSWQNERINKAMYAYEHKLWKTTHSSNYLKSPSTQLISSTDYVTHRNLNDSNVLLFHLQSLQNMKTDFINTIQITFLGVVIDINDLGFLAGLSFLILIFWFRLSLTRELRSFRLTIDKFKQTKYQEDCYNLLVSIQVHSLPPYDDLLPQNFGFDRFLPKIMKLISFLLIALPIIILITISYNDHQTVHLGNDLSNEYTKYIYIISNVILGFVIIITADCMRIFNSVNKLIRPIRY